MDVINALERSVKFLENMTAQQFSIGADKVVREDLKTAIELLKNNYSTFNLGVAYYGQPPQKLEIMNINIKKGDTIKLPTDLNLTVNGILQLKRNDKPIKTSVYTIGDVYTDGASERVVLMKGNKIYNKYLNTVNEIIKQL